MSKINIGVTQEYTQIDVTAPVEIALPDTTGSAISHLSRKIILLVEDSTVVKNHQITWSMVTGFDEISGSSSSSSTPAGSPSSAQIVWEHNDIPSVIGQVAGAQPEAILIELWEDEIAPETWVWYGKYNRYGDIPTTDETEMVDILLTADGPENSYNLGEIYGTTFVSGGTITIDDAFPVYVFAGTPPQSNTVINLRRRTHSGVESSFGNVTIIAGNNEGFISINQEIVLAPGDMVYMHSPSQLDATLAYVNVVIQGCRIKQICPANGSSGS